MEKVLSDTYKKYGYRMFDCSLKDMDNYLNNCYAIKKTPTPSAEFSYFKFTNVEDAIMKINSIFIPENHKNLPKIVWSLQESNQLLVKEVWFYNYNDRHLYQCAVERAWALGNHLDIRVEQHYYD